MNLFSAAQACLAARSWQEKCALSQHIALAWQRQQLHISDDGIADPVSLNIPGRPAHPQLVAPRDVPKRRLHTTAGRAALLHAIAHIEFNAINLAWDVVYRFRDLPRDFYADWIKVGAEEATHFLLIRQYLADLGYDYGDFPAHNGLWEMACKTDHDPMVRMALVPRVLEARGLDVTPGIQKRLASVGDQRGVQILDIIFADEIGHVEIGSRWFKYLCTQRGLEAETTFIQLLSTYMPGKLIKPFHHQARLAAGFSQKELDWLEQI